MKMMIYNYDDWCMIDDDHGGDKQTAFPPKILAESGLYSICAGHKSEIGLRLNAGMVCWD